MIVLANQLSEVGISALIGEYIAAFVEHIPAFPIQVLLLFVFYFLTMIFFSSLVKKNFFIYLYIFISKLHYLILF